MDINHSDTRRGPRLHDAAHVRKEMAVVYRLCRLNKMDASIGSKLIWMLKAIIEALETTDLEKRIHNLETRHNG